MNTHSFNLERFVTAQAPTFADALAELRRGRKESHWMWFIFPQMKGLGRSPTASFYGIESAGEAEAFLSHLLLGPRLLECTGAVLAHRGTAPEAIFGSVDAMKLQSSMTLFDAVPDAPEVFGAVLEAFFKSRRDDATLRLLGEM